MTHHGKEVVHHGPPSTDTQAGYNSNLPGDAVNQNASTSDTFETDDVVRPVKDVVVRHIAENGVAENRRVAADRVEVENPLVEKPFFQNPDRQRPVEQPVKRVIQKPSTVKTKKTAAHKN
jgi:hypothetical protein